MFWQKQRYFQLGVQGGLPRGSAFPADPRWVGGRAPTGCLGSGTRGQVCSAQHRHSWQGRHLLAAPLEWIQSRIPAASGTLSRESTKTSCASSDHSEGSHLVSQLPLCLREIHRTRLSLCPVYVPGVGALRALSCADVERQDLPSKSACLHSDNTAFT